MCLCVYVIIYKLDKKDKLENSTTQPSQIVF